MELLKFAPIVALVTLVITIVLYIVVMPRKNDGSLGGFGQALHNFFHFKKLYVESLLKFIYVLCNIGLFCFGIYFTLIGFIKGYTEFVLYGLGCLIVAPIVFRLAYEILMLGILLVKNVIDINNKLPNNLNFTAPQAPVAPVQPVAKPAAPVQPAAPAAPKTAPTQPAAAPKAAPATPVAPKAAPVQPAPVAPVAAPVTPKVEAPVAPVVEPPVAPAAPVAKPAAPKAPPAPFCTVCGSRNNPDGTCPNHCAR